ncbi:MAG: hypothetical protein GY853_02440 [PVC group bacterium]|nr:hypothetical protein [PVC group bacterium]
MVDLEDYTGYGDPELIRIIRTEWKNIRTSYHRGKITNIYSFWLQAGKENIDKLLWRVFFDHQCPFRINLNFSYILKNKMNGDLRFWSTQEYVGLLNQAKLITSNSDFEEFLRNFSLVDYVTKIFEKHPNTNWMFHRILSLCVYTYKINEGYSLLKG